MINLKILKKVNPYGLLLAILACQAGHHAFKSRFQAGLLAVDIADQTVHGRELLLITQQQAIHARLELGELDLVFGVLRTG